MTFDIEAARAAGYTDEEISNYLKNGEKVSENSVVDSAPPPDMVVPTVNQPSSAAPAAATAALAAPAALSSVGGAGAAALGAYGAYQAGKNVLEKMKPGPVAPGPMPGGQPPMAAAPVAPVQPPPPGLSTPMAQRAASIVSGAAKIAAPLMIGKELFYTSPEEQQQLKEMAQSGNSLRDQINRKLGIK